MPNISTRYQIGLATSVKFDIEAGFSVVEVALPEKKLSKTVELEISDVVFLGATVTPENTLDCLISSEPFRYA